jgi:hypothetical protein
MKYDRPVRDLMIECVRSLHEPFTREIVIEWFRQHYPDVKTSTIGAHMAGLTVGRNPDSFPHLSRFPPIIERVGHGLYARAGKSTTPSRSVAGADVVLVGCVKSKHAHPAPARDLYTSTLFARRRRHAEESGAPWFIISSRWGLVAPDEVIAPYDLYLGDMPAAYRRAWGEFVVAQLAAQMQLTGTRVEIHAGDHYVDALRPAMERAGAELIDPVDARSMGETLAWYDGNHGRDEQFASDLAVPTVVAATTPDDAEALIDRLVTALTDHSSALTPDELLLEDRAGLSGPGLYTWWADDDGAADLTRGLGHAVSPGLIYAGQAGATRWPSGKASSNALWGRLIGMHLGGRANLSTFRLTLAAILSREWGGHDEDRLTDWMYAHLSVVPAPVADADTLGVVEDAVLERLDPPLNLMHMQRTPLRVELSRLRKALGSMPGG